MVHCRGFLHQALEAAAGVLGTFCGLLINYAPFHRQGFGIPLCVHLSSSFQSLMDTEGEYIFFLSFFRCNLYYMVKPI
jgi:hypothetical protein